MNQAPLLPLASAEQADLLYQLAFAVEHFNYKLEKAEALQQVASFLAKSDPYHPSFLPLIQQAVKAANDIQEASERAPALCKIAVVLAQVKREPGDLLFNEALGIAKSIGVANKKQVKPSFFARIFARPHW